MTVYTIQQAACLIAAAASTTPSPEDAQQWHDDIYSALRDAQLTGLWPNGRPIDPQRPGALVALTQAHIAEGALNGWLAGIGASLRLEGLDPADADLSLLQWRESDPSGSDDGRPDDDEPEPELTPDDKLAALFDPVPFKKLKELFPGSWDTWGKDPKKNGLADTRMGHGLYNPYLAAQFYLRRKRVTMTRHQCNKILARELPPRSKDKEWMITGDLP